MHIWIRLSGPRHQHQEPIFYLEFCGKSGCSTSLGLSSISGSRIMAKKKQKK